MNTFSGRKEFEVFFRLNITFSGDEDLCMGPCDLPNIGSPLTYFGLSNVDPI